MRVLLALLLCLAMSLQDVASAQAFVQQPPCPMEHDGGPVDLVDTADAHDCCNDAETARLTGDPCKSAQECPLNPAVGLPSAQPPMEEGAGVHRVSVLAGGLSSLGPSGVWRPPASR